MSCSTEIPFNSSPRSDGTLTVKQTLSLVATLYQEASGEYQEKTAKLILRQSKVNFVCDSLITVMYKNKCAIFLLFF